MSRTFLIADTHFGHVGVTKFLNPDGTKLRPWDNYEEMDEVLVENWNKVVGPKDRIYHLGDVLINRRAFPILERLNGRKVLVKGNHDIFKLQEYAKYFDDIRGYHVLDKFLLSHIPVHPHSLERWEANIHGHTHSNSMNDLKYFCVSVEQINYTPIDFEFIRETYGTN